MQMYQRKIEMKEDVRKKTAHLNLDTYDVMIMINVIIIVFMQI